MVDEQYILEKQIGSNRFCINPAVRGLGGACVFALAAQQKDSFYLVLQIETRLPKFKTVQLPKNLVKEYKQRPPSEPPTHYEGTLMLCVASCSVTTDGYLTEG